MKALKRLGREPCGHLEEQNLRALTIQLSTRWKDEPFLSKERLIDGNMPGIFEEEQEVY